MVTADILIVPCSKVFKSGISLLPCPARRKAFFFFYHWTKKPKVSLPRFIIHPSQNLVTVLGQKPSHCWAQALPSFLPAAYQSWCLLKSEGITLPLLSLFLMATIRVSSMKSPRWSWKNLTQTTIRKSTCLLKGGNSGPFYFETVQQTAEKTTSGKKRDFVYD